MFTGSIAVPRPGGEGCSRVVGSLSAVLGCGLVSLHPLGCWSVGFNLLPGFVFGGPPYVSRRRRLVSLHPLGCWLVGFYLLPGLFLGTALGLSQRTGCFKNCSPSAVLGWFCTSGGVLLRRPWCVRVALPTAGGRV